MMDTLVEFKGMVARSNPGFFEDEQKVCAFYLQQTHGEAGVFAEPGKLCVCVGRP